MPNKETLGKLIRRWWLPVCWMIFIFSASTETFAEGNTSRIITPIIRWLIPTASDKTIARAHTFIRKGAHFTEYFVLAILLWRARRQGGHTRREDMNWVAMVIIAYACTDEFHQLFVSTRMASVLDIVFDSAGGLAGLLLAAAEERRRLTRKT